MTALILRNKRLPVANYCGRFIKDSRCNKPNIHMKGIIHEPVSSAEFLTCGADRTVQIYSQPVSAWMMEGAVLFCFEIRAKILFGSSDQNKRIRLEAPHSSAENTISTFMGLDYIGLRNCC